MDQDRSKPTSAPDDRYERTQVLIADLHAARGDLRRPARTSQPAPLG